MNKDLETTRDKFIEGIARMGDAFGFNRFVIQLYVFLYLNGKPLSLDEIAQALGASKGNVSINIRELEKWGAVKNIWVKGSRKDYYEAQPDIKKVFLSKVKSAIEKKISEVSSLTDEFRSIIKSKNKDLSDEEKAIAKGYEAKLKKIEELNTFALNTLNVLGKFF